MTPAKGRYLTSLKKVTSWILSSKILPRKVKAVNKSLRSLKTFKSRIQSKIKPTQTFSSPLMSKSKISYRSHLRISVSFQSTLSYSILLGVDSNRSSWWNSVTKMKTMIMSSLSWQIRKYSTNKTCQTSCCRKTSTKARESGSSSTESSLGKFRAPATRSHLVMPMNPAQTCKWSASRRLSKTFRSVAKKKKRDRRSSSARGSLYQPWKMKAMRAGHIKETAGRNPNSTRWSRSTTLLTGKPR